MQEYRRDEIIEDCADFRMLLLVVGVALDEFIFAGWEVGEHLIVEIHVFFHFIIL